MLIRFSVENFRSFRERNVFSLEMVGSKKFSDTNTSQSFIDGFLTDFLEIRKKQQKNPYNSTPLKIT